MRLFPVLFLMTVAACSEGGDLRNPLALPARALGQMFGDGPSARTRGQLEVFVKTNHPALITDIQRGGGDTLNTAFDLARVPVPARAAHTLQLQSNLALYDANLDALTAAILVASV
ncbi:hypothetical protein [Thalassorhabdomicrobium marinisediminis]|uniref:hypothetical protein n=1 Tax=Thalassorhabdomicrobium marinisediminis TaxID=2170577 RepID=UPI002490DB24|nr:hypothetical protein [Thalassorhabdomicrobium marinisediminis]